MLRGRLPAACLPSGLLEYLASVTHDPHMTGSLSWQGCGLASVCNVPYEGRQRWPLRESRLVAYPGGVTYRQYAGN